MTTGCISRFGAFGDVLHLSHIPRLVKSHYKVDHLTVETNYQGCQILQDNPFIDELVPVNPQDYHINRLFKHWESLEDKYDYFFNFYHSIEYGYIAMEDEQSYYRDSEYRRNKYGQMNFYDWHTKWAGIPESYYGTRGEMFYPDSEHKIAQDWIESCRVKYGVKYVVLVNLSGSSLHKKFIQAESISRKLLDKYPDTMIVTTGDQFCKKQDFIHPRVKSKVDSWKFRVVALMVKYMDMYIGSNTGLSCISNMWDTPTIQLFTSDSMITHSKYAKNAYGIQSPLYCSPCHKGPYKYIGCPIRQDHPACIFFDEDEIMSTLERARNECFTRTS